MIPQPDPEGSTHDRINRLVALLVELRPGTLEFEQAWSTLRELSLATHPPVAHDEIERLLDSLHHRLTARGRGSRPGLQEVQAAVGYLLTPQTGGEPESWWPFHEDTERPRPRYLFSPPIREVVLEEMADASVEASAPEEAAPPAHAPTRGFHTRSAAPSEPGERVYTVWYGTDRAPSDPANPAAGYGTARGDAVSYGTCAVNIPKGHKFGSLGSSWWKRLLRGQDDRLKLEQITALAEARFWQAVGEELQRWDEDDRQALVYVHGFNVEFTEAALRAAQIGFDLKVPGVMAFFSWPSRGAPDKYPADEATIETSEGAIAEFLVRFANDVGARRVHVLAHSMGNRGLLRAMQRIQAEAAARSRAKFGQIILAAPDVDARLFKDLARLYPQWSERTTLYASPGDRAVGLSRWLHDAARAGFTPPVTVVPGIDTVEVPDLDLDLLGHSYYAEAEGVLHDMFDLIRRNADPDDRQQLEKQALPGGETYWRLTPA